MAFVGGMITGVVGTLTLLVAALLWPDGPATPIDLED